MRSHGLQGWIDAVPGGRNEEEGMRAGEQLLSGDRLPTAVAAFNDHCAIDVLARLVRAGVDVPGTVSLAGYDNSPISQLAHLNLTSVSQEPQEQARLAVRAAVERLDGQRGTARDVVLAPRLVVRGSTAAPGDPGE
jgi:LacI family transcriptional regulator